MCPYQAPGTCAVAADLQQLSTVCEHPHVQAVSGHGVSKHVQTICLLDWEALGTKVFNIGEEKCGQFSFGMGKCSTTTCSESLKYGDESMEFVATGNATAELAATVLVPLCSSRVFGAKFPKAICPWPFWIQPKLFNFRSKMETASQPLRSSQSQLQPKMAPHCLKPKQCICFVVCWIRKDCYMGQSWHLVVTAQQSKNSWRTFARYMPHGRHLLPLADGSVGDMGQSDYGGDSILVQDQLKDVQQICTRTT